MEQDLISKKELLELAGISYGQLYRWKRKNLIPEDWFIRKSTFTGQETFFKKKPILERINRIKNLKDDLSLDELADVLSPNEAAGAPRILPNFTMHRETAAKQNIVSHITINLFAEQLGNIHILTFSHLLCAYALDKLLATGEMNLDEGKLLLQTFCEHYHALDGRPCDLIFTRKMGLPTFMLITTQSEVRFDGGVKVVARLELAAVIQELSVKLSETEERR